MKTYAEAYALKFSRGLLLDMQVIYACLSDGDTSFYQVTYKENENLHAALVLICRLLEVEPPDPRLPTLDLWFKAESLSEQLFNKFFDGHFGTVRQFNGPRTASAYYVNAIREAVA
jgi:hypothetical protein